MKMESNALGDYAVFGISYESLVGFII